MSEDLESSAPAPELSKREPDYLFDVVEWVGEARPTGMETRGRKEQKYERDAKIVTPSGKERVIRVVASLRHFACAGNRIAGFKSKDGTQAYFEPVLESSAVSVDDLE